MTIRGYDLKYATLRVDLEAQENVKLPSFHGSMIRGVLGHTIKEVSCINKNRLDCIKCNASLNCPYTKIFYGVNCNPESMLTKVNKIPNPFIIYPLNNKENYSKGDILSFRITLLGEAIAFVNYFILAIINIESRGLGLLRAKFKPKTIFDEIKKENIFDKYEILSNEIKSNSMDFKKVNVKEFKIIFETPFRTKKSGEFTSNIDFELIIRNILRRFSLLIEYYTNKENKIDYKNILEESKNIKIEKINISWKNLERMSSIKKKKLNLSGIIGEIIFKGEIGPFYDYLKIGEIIHVGKSCTMGLGHYRLEI